MNLFLSEREKTECHRTIFHKFSFDLEKSEEKPKVYLNFKVTGNVDTRFWYERAMVLHVIHKVC